MAILGMKRDSVTKSSENTKTNNYKRLDMYNFKILLEITKCHEKAHL